VQCKGRHWLSVSIAGLCDVFFNGVRYKFENMLMLFEGEIWKGIKSEKKYPGKGKTEREN
jgi:hypothetical protein